jgi:hypothetical protein
VDFAWNLPNIHNWNNPHYFQSTFSDSMKHQNATLHHPSGMTLYDPGFRTILSSVYSKENL